jgi:hypothetical protein
MVMNSTDLENILRILEIISVIVGGGTIIWRMSNMATRFEMIGIQQAAEIADLKKGVEGLSSVLVALATQGGRIDRIEDRQLSQGKRLDEFTSRINTLIDAKFYQPATVGG